MKINTYLVAFTAAIFNKIVLDDSCTWWWSSKPLQCLSPLGFWHYSVPSIALALCGLAQEDLLNTISFNINYVH